MGGDNLENDKSTEERICPRCQSPLESVGVGGPGGDKPDRVVIRCIAECGYEVDETRLGAWVLLGD